MNYNLIRRDNFYFAPRDPRGPSLLWVEQQAFGRLFAIAGLASDSSQPATETRRRISQIGERIFMGLDPYYPYSARSLSEITAYIDALPKPLGYAYRQTLSREAELLIPQPLFDEIDVGELLQGLRIWRNNRGHLNCGLLGVGLFLLFFHRCVVVTHGADIRWDRIVDCVMFSGEDTLSDKIQNIIYECEVNS